MPTEFWPNAILSLVPTLFVGFLFFFVIRAIIRMDRREREVAEKIETQERAKHAAAKAAAAKTPA